MIVTGLKHLLLAIPIAAVIGCGGGETPISGPSPSYEGGSNGNSTPSTTPTPVPNPVVTPISTVTATPTPTPEDFPIPTPPPRVTPTPPTATPSDCKNLWTRLIVRGLDEDDEIEFTWVAGHDYGEKNEKTGNGAPGSYHFTDCGSRGVLPDPSINLTNTGDYHCKVETPDPLDILVITCRKGQTPIPSPEVTPSPEPGPCGDLWPSLTISGLADSDTIMYNWNPNHNNGIRGHRSGNGTLAGVHFSYCGPIGSHPELTFEITDSGNYDCVVDNSEPVIQTIVTCSVKEPPYTTPTPTAAPPNVCGDAWADLIIRGLSQGDEIEFNWYPGWDSGWRNAKSGNVHYKDNLFTNCGPIGKSEGSPKLFELVDTGNYDCTVDIFQHDFLTLVTCEAKTEQ